MKILVFSDSHGATSGIEQALSLHEDARQVLFLGDGVREVTDISHCYPERQFHLLAGNCDFGADEPYEAVWALGGVRIYACHGHTLRVKYGLELAVAHARAADCKVLLFGHTHEAYTEYRDGLYIMNPGSISLPRASSRKQYGLLEISEKGILTSIANL